MDINRNQWFMVGLVLLLLGAELRMVESFVLTPQCTKFLAERSGHPMAAASQTAESVVQSEMAFPSKTVRPPESFGWALLSIGSVLVLHALSMKKPGG